MSRNGNGITDETFRFFDDLAANNNRDWFNAHRDTYHDSVRDPFAAFLEELSMCLADSDLPVQGGADTMFRSQRDLRFTDDKRPYSENVSGLLTRNGDKNERGRLLYLELNADGGRIGGGLHQAKAAELKPIRQRIVDQPDEFEHVRTTLAEADAHIDTSDQVATMPRGFGDHEDHPQADVIRCRQLVAMRAIPKTAWLDDTAIDRCAEAAAALSHLYDFIEAT